MTQIDLPPVAPGAFGGAPADADAFATLMTAPGTQPASASAMVVAVSTDDERAFRACRAMAADVYTFYNRFMRNLSQADALDRAGNKVEKSAYVQAAYQDLKQLQFTIDAVLAVCSDALSEEELEGLRELKEQVDDLKGQIDNLYKPDGTERPGAGARAGAFLRDAGEVMGQIGQGLGWVLSGVLGALGWALGGGRQGAF
ncbi:hypothetical protein [Futiania mangrovi]|uniref:Uncharacterized protein n=1 Tax=Futiania mangrovi TaxID=2959716 RepID=A0A9J6PKM3_9PROT|nr:hypothetical protein [Futiania mangrovii]MCP1336618.1 hypothetical protein [Futiania mangrovii]